MKKSVLLAATCVFALAVNLQAAKQRVPVDFSGSELSDNGKAKLTSANLLLNGGNRLVLAIDIDANTVELEEWDSGLNNPIDRDPIAIGVQQIILASIHAATVVNVKSNGFEFASNLEWNDADYDDNGTRDHVADLTIVGKASVDEEGRITKLSGNVQGVLNDTVPHILSVDTCTVTNGVGGVDRILQKGKVKSTGPAFLPPS